AVVRRSEDARRAREVLRDEIDARHGMERDSGRGELRVPHALHILVAVVVEVAHLQRGHVLLIAHRYPGVRRGTIVTLDENPGALAAGRELQVAIPAAEPIADGPAAQRQQPTELVGAVRETDERIELDAAFEGAPPLAL